MALRHVKMSEEDTIPSTPLEDTKRYLSPYLNFDPDYIPQIQPEFIFLDGTTKTRGRFELAFGQIGGACMIGALLGGLSGLGNGLKVTKLAGQTGKMRFSQMINHIMKRGSGRAHTFGTISVYYAVFGVLLSKIRGTDDDINTVVSATATGLLYKSTDGLRKCGLGGGVGLATSLAYVIWKNSKNLKSRSLRSLIM